MQPPPTTGEQNWGVVGERRIFFHSGDVDVSYLSNFHRARFTVRGTAYTCVEQYFQHAKMTRYDRTVVAEAILAATAPASMKALGRRGPGAQLSPEEVSDWGRASFGVMYEGVSAKFAQNPDLAQRLASTWDATLVERLERGGDRLWGVTNSAARGAPPVWVGHNLLGSILMGVRLSCLPCPVPVCVVSV